MFARKPRFAIGDQVKVVGPGDHSGKQGVVAQVVESSADFVHRYKVRLSEEVTATFFGFELESNSTDQES